VLNVNINEISLQQEASFNIPTQIYYWHLHVSSFKKRYTFGNSYRHTHLLIIILLSNQVEFNPGPQSLDDSSYPCSICFQECTWDSDAIVCDNCDKWCHIGCVNISPSMYEKYGNTSVLWICPVCDTPNHSRTIFLPCLSPRHSLLCSNSYFLLTNNSEISLNINDNIGDPLAASSPKPPPPPRNKKRFYVQNNLITALTVNFRSCKNKVPEIENLLTSFKPDIIIGSETWLNKNVLSSEVFPSTLFVMTVTQERAGVY